MTIPLLQPSCTEEEIAAVTRVLQSLWWGCGPVCEEVEAFLCAQYGYPYCVTVNSATAALHLSLLAHGIGPGDEVIVPALTFISTALAVSYTGATPIFADVHPATLCLEVDDVQRRATERTRAVIPVDYAGYPAWENVRIPFPVIQDAAHSCGGAGYGDEICLSFHPVKNIATGDGGAILTRSEERYHRLKALRWCGIDKSTWERVERRYGWDYNIPEGGFKCHWNDIQAAIGLVQLRRMDELLARRREIARQYTEALRGLCSIPVDHPQHTWHLYPIRVPVGVRDSIVDHVLSLGISVGVHYKPLTHYAMYAQPTPAVTHLEWRRLISLPIFYDMTDDEVSRVVEALRASLRSM